jgi:predicted SprT family Zn-dependent metalloprotease
VLEQVKQHDTKRFRSATSCWAKSWGVESLEERVNVVFSPRMVKSLGRCDLRSKTIRLNPMLRRRRGRILLEVLCHEAAHIAVHEKYGPDGCVAKIGFKIQSTSRALPSFSLQVGT